MEDLKQGNENDRLSFDMKIQKMQGNAEVERVSFNKQLEKVCAEAKEVSRVEVGKEREGRSNCDQRNNGGKE